MKKHILIGTAILSLLINSCQSYYISRETISEDIVDTYNIADFDTYVFKLCKASSVDRDSDLMSENLAFPFFELCEDNDDLVVEETYLLVPKPNINSDKVIYITSLSHKYLDKGKGVFNCPIFKDKIFIEDVDMVYIGTINKNQLSFYKNTAKAKNRYISKWNFERDSVNNIKIINVTLAESHFNPKPQIELNKTFSSDIIFKKENRTLMYGKNKSDFQSCFDKKNVPRLYGKNIGSQIQNIIVTEENFYFSSYMDVTKKEYYKFSIKRLPYYYKYKSNVEKINSKK